MTDARDVAAWELAIKMLRDSGEAVWVNGVDRALEERGLEEAGRWAAAQMQFVTLRSRPWLALPCDLVTYGDADLDAILAADNDESGKRTAAVLLKRMRDAGVSDWHPDPMAALAKAAKKSGAAA
jgi:hypothetical protein